MLVFESPPLQHDLTLPHQNQQVFQTKQVKRAFHLRTHLNVLAYSIFIESQTNLFGFIQYYMQNVEHFEIKSSIEVLKIYFMEMACQS